jgi:hypothetical protein
MRNHRAMTGTNGDSFRRLEVITGVGRRRPVAHDILRARGVSNVSEAIDTNALSLDRPLADGLPKPPNRTDVSQLEPHPRSGRGKADGTMALVQPRRLQPAGGAAPARPRQRPEAGRPAGQEQPP